MVFVVVFDKKCGSWEETASNATPQTHSSVWAYARKYQQATYVCLYALVRLLHASDGWNLGLLPRYFFPSHAQGGAVCSLEISALAADPQTYRGPTGIPVTSCSLRRGNFQVCVCLIFWPSCALARLQPHAVSAAESKSRDRDGMYQRTAASEPLPWFTHHRSLRQDPALLSRMPPVTSGWKCTAMLARSVPTSSRTR